MSNIFTIYYNLQNIIITLKKLDVLFDKIENLNLYCNNKEELKNTLVISQLLYTKYKTIDWFIDLYKNIIFISYKKTKLVDIYNYIKNPELLTIKESKNLYPKKYLDSILLEYIKLNNNVRTFIIHPIEYNSDKLNDIEKLILSYGMIYYENKIKIQGISKYHNLLKQINFYDERESLYDRAYISYKNEPLIFILIDFYDLTQINEFIKNCKKIFKTTSFDLCETKEDTFRISSILLNNNTLNKLDFKFNPYIKNLLNIYFDFFENDKDNCCIFTISKFKITYIHINNIIIKSNIIYNEDIEFIELEDIAYFKRKNLIYNPDEYYYYNGFKFKKNNSNLKELINKFEENT